MYVKGLYFIEKCHTLFPSVDKMPDLKSNALLAAARCSMTT